MSDARRDRSSAFKGLLLILLGLLFLLHRFYPEFGIGHLIRIYWPLLFIIWGVTKLIEHLAAKGDGGVRPSYLTGGEAALLILVVCVLVAFSVADMVQRRHPGMDLHMDMFSQRYAQSTVVPPAKIRAGAMLTVQTGLGNITVHAGDTDEVHATTHEMASGHSESAAHARMNETGVVMEKSGDGYLLHALKQDSSSGRVNVDFDVEVPKTITLTAITPHGDINISGITGGVTAIAENGDIEIHDSGSDVSVQMKKGDARISDVAGDVRITGKGSEIDVTDVKGDATLDGDFYGPIRLRNVSKTTHYTSQRTDLTLLHLTGRLELDSGEIDIADVAGFAKINTHNKDMDVENVAGRLEIVDTHGDISVNYSEPPREEVSIVNESGQVDLTLPAKSSFEISAVSRNGEVQSDFEDPSLKQANDSDTGGLNGRIGTRGPKIAIVTSYGTVYLRRSS
ncbi:MAG: DUF4097 family beta strand repeat-containing protein [Candidatus Acidiferrales bacterium]